MSENKDLVHRKKTDMRATVDQNTRQFEKLRAGLGGLLLLERKKREKRLKVSSERSKVGHNEIDVGMPSERSKVGHNEIDVGMPNDNSKLSNGFNELPPEKASNDSTTIFPINTKSEQAKHHPNSSFEINDRIHANLTSPRPSFQCSILQPAPCEQNRVVISPTKKPMQPKKYNNFRIQVNTTDPIPPPIPLTKQQPSSSMCVNENTEAVSDTPSTIDSGIDCDKRFDTCSPHSFEYQEDEIEANDKIGEWPVNQLSAISSLLEKIKQERCGPKAHDLAVCRDLNSIIQSFFKGCHCRLYGSYNSGFAVENSDINMELYPVAKGTTARFLNEVQKIIAKKKPNYSVSFESSVKLKDCCITLIEPEYGTYCKLKCLDNGNNYDTSELLKELSSLDPCVETLVIALRHWAEVCNMHEVDNGGLHSLCYTLMVIHFLQQHNPPVLPIVDIKFDSDDTISHTLCIFKQAKKNSVPELWLALFEYYSNFNWRDRVINITSHRPLLKASTTWEKCWIAVQAPFNPTLNVAKSVISPDISQYIQSCFMRTYKYFSKATGTCVKQLSDEVQLMSDKGLETLSEIPEYNYCFDKLNFTDGTNVPQFCQECDELGYTCEDCMQDSSDEEIFLPIPNLDDTFNQKIEEALEDAFEEYVLKDEEIRRRIQIVKEIENYIRKKFWDTKLELMGSTVNGFGFRKSDLDICLTFENKAFQEINATEIIRKLRQHLRRNRDLTSVLAIFGAKIPLVQFVHQGTGLRGDLSLYNLLAVRNSKLLHSYSIIDKRVKILGCAMKLLAKCAGIADTADKSLSSYSYILMVIHYLQRTNPPILPALQELPKTTNKGVIVEGWDTWYFSDKLDSVWKREVNKASVGELWFGLLKYYTEDLDLQTIISIRDSKSPCIKDGSIKTAKLFNIQDPFILSKNLGAVMSDAMSIRTSRTLNRARKLLSIPLAQIPSGFKTLKEYLFDPMNLTDGRINKVIECDVCGKLGHKKEKCARYNYNFMRGRGRPWTFRGNYHNYQSSYHSDRGQQPGSSFRRNTPKDENRPWFTPFQTQLSTTSHRSN